MAIFKQPTNIQFKNGNTPPWLGFQNAQITSFKDKTNEYDWADIYLELKLNTKSSEYPVTMNIAGHYERDENDNIIECSLTRKLFSLFNAIGFGGGPDEQTGKLLTAAGGNIEDVTKFFNNNYAAGDSPEYPYTIYVYKRKVLDKNTGEENVWTRVDSRIAKTANAKQLSRFMDYVKWAKDNGVIIEHVSTEEESSSNSFSAVSTTEDSSSNDETSDPWDKPKSNTPSYRVNK